MTATAALSVVLVCSLGSVNVWIDISDQGSGLSTVNVTAVGIGCYLVY